MPENIKVTDDIDLWVADGRITLCADGGNAMFEVEVDDVDTLRAKLTAAVLVAVEQRQMAAQYTGPCMVRMIHEDKSEMPCVLQKSHLLDDSDHEDAHGHHAPVLVHQSTIRQVQAIQDARDAGLIE
jgi:hypothetical protein